MRRNALKTTAQDAQEVLAGRPTATARRKRSEYDAAFPAVACRLPKATADELKAIADATGFTLGELVAAALTDFGERYKRGDVTITAKERPTVRRVAGVAS